MKFYLSFHRSFYDKTKLVKHHTYGILYDNSKTASKRMDMCTYHKSIHRHTCIYLFNHAKFVQRLVHNHLYNCHLMSYKYESKEIHSNLLQQPYKCPIFSLEHYVLFHLIYFCKEILKLLCFL